MKTPQLTAGFFNELTIKIFYYEKNCHYCNYCNRHIICILHNFKRWLRELFSMGGKNPFSFPLNSWKMANYTWSGQEHKLVPIETVKRGDFFRLKGGKQVYVSERYCPQNKKYCGQSYDDISKFTYKRKGTLVEYDFTF